MQFVQSEPSKWKNKGKREKVKKIKAFIMMHLNPHPAISVVVVLLPSALAVLAHINKHAVNKR